MPVPPLPPQPTRLIGREADVARIRTLLLERECRLVTLTGPGGVGKTRLAIDVAEAVTNAFETVGLVDLAPITDPSLVVGACAHLLHVRETPGRPLPEALAAALRGHTTLLILDNLEHLPAVAPVVETLAATNPGLTLLVTSREPLHLRRERVVEVAPLAVPPARSKPWSVAELANIPGVALFVERAQAADDSFVLDDGNAAAVAELSRRLDGLPLTLELAAARTRLLDPAALLARVEHGLALLRWDAPDLPARQRTLQATLDWSYALLSRPEQTIFRRLGVFAGSFTLEAVADATAVTELEVEPLEVVSALADKHLVRALGSGSGAPRFALLATMREYAREQLAANEELEVTRHRHLTHYLTLAEQTAEARQSPGEASWLVRLAVEEADLRQALEWAVTTGNIEAELGLVSILWELWASQGALREGVARVEEALARAGEAELAPVAWLY
jgi:predicted ATPase